jgi:type II secretory ATPase GspE/PulE/Tfp pilus assembly ATPase PilB-like protein
METATLSKTSYVERFLEGLRENGAYDAYEVDAFSLRFRSAPASAVLNDLVVEGRLSRAALAALWSEATNVAHIDPSECCISEEAVAALPFEVASKAQAIGIYLFAGVLTVAMADPLDAAMVGRLEKVSRRQISPVFAFEVEISDAIALHYKGRSPLDAILQEAELAGLPSLQSLDERELISLAGTTPIIKLFDSILLSTLQLRGTDIHLQPEEQAIALRIRTDGFLKLIGRLPRSIGPALVTRAKIVSKLDIAESRLPQDGRFSLNVGGHSAHFRVSTLPSIHGEKLVIRVLAATGRKGFTTLDKMLISRRVLVPLRRLSKAPNGIIFVTGPTGSGKTSTLYSILQEINEPHHNLLTIEDPVEYQLPGLTQVQVQRSAGLDFPVVLRSVLRQDPDILLVGEIRDRETARIAAEAALTGHLVFSTLHTNNAAQAILRLTEMGVEPYVVAPSVIGVLAQRLVRRICDYCRESFVAPRELLQRYFHDADDCGEVVLQRGRGCTSCGGSGYHGRLAIHEFVVVTDEIRELVLAGANISELSKVAVQNGTRSLRYDGLLKAFLGLTTLEEVERVTVEEWE